MKEKFKNYRGERIPNIIEYIEDYIQKTPRVTIAIGCDSNEKRKGSIYATTIMFYDGVHKDGAHVVYRKDFIRGKMDTFTRLYKESELIYELVEYIEQEISNHKRDDLTEYQIKKYKFHQEQHKGLHLNVTSDKEEKLINSMQTFEADKHVPYKICDVHLDYNMEDGDGRNRSHNVFKSALPWFKSSGYRVWCKPYSAASTTAADSLVN
jgi:predicted RNase H-related nuclease YkuK (DUF458 family)